MLISFCRVLKYINTASHFWNRECELRYEVNSSMSDQGVFLLEQEYWTVLCVKSIMSCIHEAKRTCRICNSSDDKNVSGTSSISVITSARPSHFLA